MAADRSLGEGFRGAVTLHQAGEYAVVHLPDGGYIAVYSDGGYLRRTPDGVRVSGLTRTKNGATAPEDWAS